MKSLPRAIVCGSCFLIVGWLLPLKSNAQTFTWDGGGITNGWTNAVNWVGDVAPDSEDGTAYIEMAGTVNFNVVVDSTGPWNLNRLVFLSGATNFTISGQQLRIGSGGITNLSTRAQTINNHIEVVAGQTWHAATLVNFNGNLSGSATLTLSTPLMQASGDGVLPNWRFSGNNSGYTGQLRFSGQRQGLALMNPSAMIGGNISLGPGNASVDRQYLYLSGSSSGNPFTFGIGTGAGNVQFNPSSNTSGGLVHNGNQWLRLGGSGDYTWNPSTLYVEGRVSGTTGALTLGQAGEKLILGGTFDSNVKTFKVDGTAVVDLKYSLDDTAQSGRTLRKTGSGLLILNAPASGAQTTVNALNAGLLAVSNMNQLFDGNLDIGNNNGSGVFVFDGISWSDFASDRSGGEGSGANQWRLTGTGSPGFAARGTAVTIDSTATSASTFNRNFTLGSGFTALDGTLYANAGVTIARDTTLTGRRFITLGGHTGPGLTNSTSAGVVHVLEGNWSGTGVPYFTASSRDGTPGGIAEIVLRGTNTWTGNPYFGVEGAFFNPGSGGLNAGAAGTGSADGNDVFVRFDGDASFPSGGGTAYYAASRRNGIDYQYGYLLTGGATEKVYDLPSGKKFLIGPSAGASQRWGVFGSGGGLATIRNSALAIHRMDTVLGTATNAFVSLGLLVRDGQLTLGTTGSAPDGPFQFQPSASVSEADSGATGPATTIVDRGGGTSQLVKRGEGTLVLGNVQYTLVDGSGDTASRFSWQLGRGTGGNTGAGTYFDGAVRGVLGGGNANSLENFTLNLRGGVYEVDVSAGSGTLNKTLGTGAGQINWRPNNNVDSGGGGFAAYSSVPGNVLTVDLNTAGVRDNLQWNVSNGPFLGANVGGTGVNLLILGSPTANALVDFYDNIDLNGGNGSGAREIRVLDNPAVSTDIARLSGVLSGSGPAANLLKTGAGVLELTAINTYSGTTTVAQGTLRINGTLSTQPTPVIVNSGATLGGSGTINRPVTIQAGARLDPGSSPGTFTVGSLSLAGTSIINFELGEANVVGGASNDLVVVNGNLTLDGVLNVTALPGFSVGTYRLFNYTGTLTDNTLDLGTLPGGYGYTIDTSVAGQVNLVVVPEPGTWALVGAGLGLLWFLQRRSRPHR